MFQIGKMYLLRSPLEFCLLFLGRGGGGPSSEGRFKKVVLGFLKIRRGTTWHLLPKKETPEKDSLSSSILKGFQMGIFFVSTSLVVFKGKQKDNLRAGGP